MTRRTIALTNLRDLAERAVVAAGFAADDAAIIVDVLLYAELRDNNQGLAKVAEGIVVRAPDERASKTLAHQGGFCLLDAGR
ncbi:MAG: hypothetical protein OEQ29_18580, partial [Alphaproteobacteria bacterium]|nr:hypothetical protein [Alphaproteobacteria bacterium]